MPNDQTQHTCLKGKSTWPCRWRRKETFEWRVQDEETDDAEKGCQGEAKRRMQRVLKGEGVAQEKQEDWEGIGVTWRWRKRGIKQTKVSTLSSSSVLDLLLLIRYTADVSTLFPISGAAGHLFADDAQAYVHGPPSSQSLLITSIQSLPNCLHC